MRKIDGVFGKAEESTRMKLKAFRESHFSQHFLLHFLSHPYRSTRLVNGNT